MRHCGIFKGQYELPFCAFSVVNQPVGDPGEAGGSPPLFLDETEVQRVEKIIFKDRPALSKGIDDRPPLSQDRDPALLAVYLQP